MWSSDALICRGPCPLTEAPVAFNQTASPAFYFILNRTESIPEGGSDDELEILPFIVLFAVVLVLVILSVTMLQVKQVQLKAIRNK